MIYSSKQIDNMKEADVRANILDPIILRLGYNFGAENYCERERTLRYPFAQIGHRSLKDVPLGACDYVCGIDGRNGSFALEAKRGSHKLCIEDIQQAHSYAVHPEICAEFFLISNGHEIRIYRTLSDPNDDPIIIICNSELEQNFYQIETLLSPISLKKHAKVTYDTGLPLASGLGSQQRIIRGFVRSKQHNYRLSEETSPVAQMFINNGLLEKLENELNNLVNQKQPVEQGQITRNQNGKIIASATFGSSRPDLEYNMNAIGIQELSFISDVEVISESSENKSLFETITEKSVLQGTLISTGFKEGLKPMGIDVNMEILIRGFGHVNDGKFLGEYEGFCIYDFKIPHAEAPQLMLNFAGDFELVLD